MHQQCYESGHYCKECYIEAYVNWYYDNEGRKAGQETEPTDEELEDAWRREAGVAAQPRQVPRPGTPRSEKGER